MVPIEMSSPHSYSTYMHTIGLILRRLATIQNAADRQTDRHMVKGRLCCSIGGLLVGLEPHEALQSEDKAKDQAIVPDYATCECGGRTGGATKEDVE